MSRLQDYIDRAISNNSGEEFELRSNVERFNENVLRKSKKNGVEVALLMGHVQSGKTSQMMSAISLAADNGYKSFIVLTSSNSMLQKQTYLRCKRSLSDIEVYDEAEDVAFRRNGLRESWLILDVWS